MSEENLPNEENSTVNNQSGAQEVTSQTDENLSKEIERLSQEATTTVLPSDQEIESDIALEPETDNLEEGNTETVQEVKEIPLKDYDSMEPETLIKELDSLIKNYPIQSIKDHTDGIKNAIYTQFDTAQDKARNAFLEEGGNSIDFRYFSPLKKAFNEVYYEYRNKRSEHFQNKQKDQKASLAHRQEIIEEVKNLREELGGAESVNTTFNKFKELQERWNNAGNIPRDRYNLVWNNYYHHVDSFYELLHLNRAFRDKHFADNLAQKMQLIDRAEELNEETNIGKAFKELQLLHRMWKEEIGPVSKQHSDEIWDRFSVATKKIHDKRDEHFKGIEKKWEQNLAVKNEIIQKINEIASSDLNSHKVIQESVKNVESLREIFFKAGKVPNEVNEETWASFKGAVKEFNKNKNGFYKSQKQEQYDNLAKKKALIQIAHDNKDNEDVTATIQLMKKIQGDWKKIGHVPRKDSDKVWKEFKDTCNEFFDRLNASKKESEALLEEAFVKKQALLESVKELKLEGAHNEKLQLIMGKIGEWKEIGRVPYAKKAIDETFNKTLDGLFQQLDMDRKEVEMIKYENRLQSMGGGNSQDLSKEQFFITKKIQEVKGEINQLENNLGFFQHVKEDNPMFVEVKKNIEKHKVSLEGWIAKQRKLKTFIRNQEQAQNQEQETVKEETQEQDN